VLRYEDISREPEVVLKKISQKFNVSLQDQTKNFLHFHNNARWKEEQHSKRLKNPKAKNTTNILDLVENLEKAENPLQDIFKDMAKQKEFKQETDFEEDINIIGNKISTEIPIEIEVLEEGSANEDDSADYYDSKGKLMTVRRKRSLLMLPGKSLKKKRNYVNEDPEGRSYYFSTFRKKNFDPDHWKNTLPKNISEAVLKEENCRKVLEYHSYDF